MPTYVQHGNYCRPNGLYFILYFNHSVIIYVLKWFGILIPMSARRESQCNLRVSLKTCIYKNQGTKDFFQFEIFINVFR